MGRIQGIVPYRAVPCRIVARARLVMRAEAAAGGVICPGSLN